MSMNVSTCEGIDVYKYTPPKTNMAPENRLREKGIPNLETIISTGSMLVFGARIYV